MENAMKAMVYHAYGSPDNLEFAEIEMPVVKDDEVLVKVHAASVNWLDWHFLAGSPFLVRLMAGLRKPKYPVLGIDFAGRIEAIGTNVTQFQQGDDVFGAIRHGCFAEYVCVTEDELVNKPANLTFEEAAAVPGAGSTALRALRDYGQVQPGQNVLINGASGGVGIFAVQIAKAMGAVVTGVCSTRNLEIVSAIGADKIIDYTRDDFTQNGESYDLIFDAVAKHSFSECKGALKLQGIYITTAFSPGLVLRANWLSITGNKNLAPISPVHPNKTNLTFLANLLENGYVKPAIDRHYSLRELPDALRYLENGHVRGKIVVTI
jgi:NADPH:quinone reductase-like Zn-dependent oxidoreductase